MVYLTRKESFNAAHKLYNEMWSREKNEEVFGVCSNENWHGHNYDLYVTIKGSPNPDTGFVYDVKKLGLLVRENVVDHLDHKNLNIDVPFLTGQFPSTENVAIAIWKILNPLLPDTAKLHCIKLVETSKIYVEYFGE
ncbi:MAG: 6-carboxytetrahydropterin synthase [Bacteroidetes bacterium]|jgi:6-pyruvoyltetrahydropterin/6-carboxytetrahydropterin synthase|nr:6-carboxytetrahydropterin synthase [Bacteroidota bacterium]